MVGEKVHLECESAPPREIVEHMLEWRIRNQTAIPVMLAVDFDWGKSRRERRAGHDMLGKNAGFGTIEIGEPACSNVYRADA